MARLLILFLLSVSLVAPSAAQLPEMRFRDASCSQVTIPFELHNNLVILTIRINGIPLRFILDSGVSATVITDPLLMQVLGLKPERKILVAGVGCKETMNALVTKPALMELAGIEGINQTILVLEEDFLKISQYFGLEAHGLIGYELLNRFLVEIDYPGSVLRIHAPGKYQPSGRFCRLPLVIEGNRPFLSVPVEFKPGLIRICRLLVDLGASQSCLFELDEKDSALIPGLSLEENQGRGIGGDIPGHLGRISGMSLGPFRFNQVLASFIDNYHTNFQGQPPHDGNLGSELLSRFHLVFDYAGSQLYLHKTNRFDRPFEHNMSGMDLCLDADHPGAYRVYDVRNPSPACEAGLQPGDLILRVNGLRPSELCLADLLEMLRSRPGKMIRLRVLRDGVETRPRFRLKRLI